MAVPLTEAADNGVDSVSIVIVVVNVDMIAVDVGTDDDDAVFVAIDMASDFDATYISSSRLDFMVTNRSVCRHLTRTRPSAVFTFNSFLSRFSLIASVKID